MIKAPDIRASVAFGDRHPIWSSIMMMTLMWPYNLVICISGLRNSPDDVYQPVNLGNHDVPKGQPHPYTSLKQLTNKNPKPEIDLYLILVVLLYLEK